MSKSSAVAMACRMRSPARVTLDFDPPGNVGSVTYDLKNNAQRLSSGALRGFIAQRPLERVVGLHRQVR